MTDNTVNGVSEGDLEEMTNPEKESKKSVDAAGKAVNKQAAARRGDKRNPAKMEKIKAPAGSDKGMKQVATDAMESLSDEQLSRVYTFITSELEENTHTYADELNDLVESEATLSEGFKTKAAAIFEANVNARVAGIKAELEEAYAEKMDEAEETVREEMTEAVDKFLDYAVSEWMKENELAIESGVRTQVAENFITGLKGLFEEAHFDIPEADGSVVEELSDKLEEMTNKADQVTEALLEAHDELEAYQKIEAIRTVSEGLADTEVEKLATLSRDLEFVDAEDYTSKVSAIRETYFKKKPANGGVNLEENVTEGNGDDLVETNDDYMKSIVAHLGRN